MSSGIKLNDLGERLKALRVTQGLSINEVAKIIGVAESTYRDWEYGRQIMGEPYEKLAKAFNTSLSFLMTGEPHEIASELEKIERIIRALKIKL